MLSTFPLGFGQFFPLNLATEDDDFISALLLLSKVLPALNFLETEVLLMCPLPRHWSAAPALLRNIIFGDSRLRTPLEVTFMSPR